MPGSVLPMKTTGTLADSKTPTNLLWDWVARCFAARLTSGASPEDARDKFFVWFVLNIVSHANTRDDNDAVPTIFPMAHEHKASKIACFATKTATPFDIVIVLIANLNCGTFDMIWSAETKRMNRQNRRSRSRTVWLRLRMGVCWYEFCTLHDSDVHLEYSSLDTSEK